MVIILWMDELYMEVCGFFINLIYNNVGDRTSYIPYKSLLHCWIILPWTWHLSTRHHGPYCLQYFSVSSVTLMRSLSIIGLVVDEEYTANQGKQDGSSLLGGILCLLGSVSGVLYELTLQWHYNVTFAVHFSRLCSEYKDYIISVLQRNKNASSVIIVC